MRRLRLLLCVAVLLSSFVASAQTVIEKPNYSVPSKIAPAYFGPNAFSVPDMLDGRTSSELKLELYADFFVGTSTSEVSDDVTCDAFAKLTIPLFTPKVNLTVWMPVYEYYNTSAAVNAMRRLSHQGELEGECAGDVYLSADVSILNQERHHVDLAMRAALKTASANQFSTGRYYDAPGYFFDAALGRNFNFGGSDHNLRIAVSTGFLCWQTGTARQNDALMYGAMLAYSYKGFSIDTTFGGYVGWENDGDAPMTLKTNLSYNFGKLALKVGHQVGFMDWPYHQIRIGASYAFNVLKSRK